MLSEGFRIEALLEDHRIYVGYVYTYTYAYALGLVTKQIAGVCFTVRQLLGFCTSLLVVETFTGAMRGKPSML